eukprot:9085396-Karenia_brevis.AAC.1
MEGMDLCEGKRDGTGPFAHNPEEAEKYMEDRRLHLVPVVETLILLALPENVEYHNGDCMKLCPRDFHP